MKTPDELKPLRKVQAIEEISTSNYSDLQKHLLLECLEAYFDLTTLEQEKEFEDLLNTEEFQEAKNMGITTHEKGILEGIEQGVEQGQRDLILQILEERFGDVSNNIKKEINEWSGDYSILVSRILKADGIEDVDFEDPR